MKVVFLRVVTALILLISPSTAESHKFTSSKGKVVDASIVDVKPTTITLRLKKNGNQVSVKRSNLSPKDQAYIAKWTANQLPDLNITPGFKRNISQTRRGTYEQEFNFKLQIENLSPNLNLEDSKATLIIVGKSVDRSKTYKIISHQTKDFSIPSGESLDLQFDPISNIYGLEDEPGVEEEDRQKVGFQGLGYIIHIERQRDNKMVHFNSPSTVLEPNKEKILKFNQGDIIDRTFTKLIEAGPKEEEEDEKDGQDGKDGKGGKGGEGGKGGKGGKGGEKNDEKKKDKEPAIAID